MKPTLLMSPTASDAQRRLAGAVLEIVSEACGDDLTRDGLAAMLNAGAWLRVSVDVPAWDMTCDLIRGDQSARLFTVHHREFVS